MEITVRQGPNSADGVPSETYAAAATFLQHGARALERVQLSAKAKSHHGAMLALTTGFKVNPNAFDDGSVERNVLTALCKATGVVEVEE
jgi:hypothetical protein